MTLTQVRDAMAALGFSPSKSLGQNFLIDQNLAGFTVDALGICPGNHVIEIGPGLGALTERLVDRATSLTLIEKDDRLIGHLRERFSAPHVEILHTDALEVDPLRFLGRGPIRIVGNLPYYISTPLIEKFTNPLLAPERLIFLLQRELADRLNAEPRTKEYGAMTICVGRRWRVRCLRNFPPSVFHPEPGVQSALVAFDPRPASDIPICDEALFERLVRSGFSERRKQLRNLLPDAAPRWPELCKLLRRPETVRAEELSQPDWAKLAALICPLTAQNRDEYFDVVDENDVVIGPKPRGEVHANDLRHRAIHVLIFNGVGELFLQKRSIWKDKNPGLWDSSTAGHVDAGETYEQAAHREIAEEIGVAVPTLRKVCKLGSGPETGFEFLMVYTAHHNGPFTFEPTEVEGGAFFPVDRVANWLRDSPDQFTPIFQQAFPAVRADIG